MMAGFAASQARTGSASGVFDYRLDLAEDATLHSSGALLLRVSPAVFYLNQLRPRRYFAVDMCSQFDLITIAVKALVALNVTEE